MSTPEPSTDASKRPPLSPLEGGAWRPVQPHELLKKGPVSENEQVERKPAATLERRQELERFIRNRPADIDAYLELAAIYRGQGRAVEAARVLKVAQEVEPGHSEVLWQLEEASLARALQQLKDVRDVAQRLNTPEATRELERAQTDWACRRAEVCRARIERDPSAAHLRVVLAEALRDLGDYAEAIASAEHALHCDSESPLAHWIIGQCHNALGNTLQALSAWRHVALRRAVPAPAKLRVAALKAACEQAERLGLSASLSLYQQALHLAEQDATQQQDRPHVAPTVMLIEAPPNPPPASKRSSGDLP